MKRNGIYILIILVLAAIIYTMSRGDSDQVNELKSLNDSILQVIENQKNEIKKYKVEVIDLNQEQESLEKIADSLAQEAAKPIPCEHKVQIQDQEIKSLRGALNKCKEVKAIQVKTIGLCDSLLISHELVLVNTDKMLVINRQEKRKTFLKGLGLGAGAGALLVLLIFI